MLESSAPNADREPKATILLDRITNMKQIVSRLSTLRDRIAEGNVPRINTEGPIEVEPSPSLANVLNQGPEILQICFNQMIDLIDQIEQEVF